MIKLTKRSLLAFFISFVLMLISASISHAQESGEEEAKKLGISFPIVELGNCGSLSACKAFCDNEANRDKCRSFAQKKGIKTDNRGPKDSKVLESARSELGCDSETSCRAVCEQEVNRDKCASFGQKHGLGGPRGGGPGDKNVLNKAKETLGCDSEASCKSVCENPANQEKCNNFAKATGLGGGIRRVGPGGCNSEESCKAFCENNEDECRKFGGAPEGAGSDRRGPDGCNSEESCRKICESNPEKCQGFGGQGPRDMESFCSENPDKCSGDRFSGSGGDKSGPNRGSEDFGRPPEGFDRRGPDGSRPYVMPPEGFTNPQTGQPEYDPMPQPSGNEGSGDSVRGINTQRGLLQQVLDWFKL